MNPAHHRPDVSIAVGKLLRIELPVTIIVLPAVIQRDPGKSHSLNFWQCVVNLLRLEVAPVSPSAPDRSKSTLRGFGHLKALFHHELTVGKQRLEVVSLVDCNERAKRVEAFARLQGLVTTILHADPGLARVGHGNGQ